MAEDEGSAEKTEDASPKKKQEAREQGRVVTSKEMFVFGSMVIMLAGLTALPGQMPDMISGWSDGLRLPDKEGLDSLMLARSESMLGVIALTLVLVGAPLIVVVILLQGAMGGINFAPQALGPNFGKLNPMAGLGRMVSKQALIELAPDPAALQAPVTDAAFATATAPLWAWYDALRPNLWREGTTFPENESIQQQLLNDGEVDVAMSFDPASTAAAIAQGLLPETARVWVPKGGSIGNISFVAIPYNAAHKEGAEVVANFLLDPATQAHMQNIEVLGSFSVLDPTKLDEAAKAAFAALPSAPALPSVADLGPTLLEPHASWMTRLTEEWARRYTE